MSSKMLLVFSWEILSMSLFELFILAVGLSMDAFAVAICKGLAIGKIQWRHALIVGLWFGGFQALMPLIGYFFGSRFASYIAAVDHWIAMILLASIGVNMIRESRDKDPEHVNPSLRFKTMLGMPGMSQTQSQNQPRHRGGQYFPARKTIHRSDGHDFR